ncbi:MAG: class I SAM-dependent methyltransferase [Sulfuritalea sp.]|jgi:SAM-dependent methyltransferase|nr:class I SAM-dependent methyltransferase [Sulfuritalea sp.]
MTNSTASAPSAALVMRCPVCEGSQFQPGPEVFDDRYGEPNRYQLARCSHCGHLATAPRLAESELSTLYGTYYPRKGINPADVRRDAAAVTRPLARLSRWSRGVDNQGQYRVRAGETMLDVGCGSGVSLLEAQALGASVFGIEADPNVRLIAEALGLAIHFGSLQDQPFPGQRFDLVVLNQVIEHLPDPDRALQLLRARLAPGGCIVLVFPNTRSLWRRLSGTRWINWHIPYHLHHFDRTNFSRMARRCGFEVSAVRSITPNLWTLLQLRASRQQPVRGQPSPIWATRPADSTPGSGQPSALLKWVLRLPVMTLLALVNRVVDATGIGDSLLVELRPEGGK